MEIKLQILTNFEERGRNLFLEHFNLSLCASRLTENCRAFLTFIDYLLIWDILAKHIYLLCFVSYFLLKYLGVFSGMYTFLRLYACVYIMYMYTYLCILVLIFIYFWINSWFIVFHSRYILDIFCSRKIMCWVFCNWS